VTRLSLRGIKDREAFDAAKSPSGPHAPNLEPVGDGGRLPLWGGVPFFSVERMRDSLVAQLLNLGHLHRNPH
jgi:hypothetical protein